MSAVLIDSFGWIPLSSAAKAKLMAVQTLADTIERLDVPTKKIGRNVWVKLSDIDKAIENFDEEGEGGGKRKETSKRNVPAPEGRERRRNYRPPAENEDRRAENSGQAQTA